MTRNEAVIEAGKKGYRVTEDGRIVNHKGKVIKGSIDKTKGYPRISVTIDGKTRDILIHRLAAYQWFGEKVFRAGVLVRHIDGDKCNFSKSNIAIGSYEENANDMSRYQRIKRSMKRRNLTTDNVIDIRNKSDQGIPYSALSKEYNVSISLISLIVNKKIYSNVAA